MEMLSSYNIVSQALSRRRAALGFALRVRAWLRLVKPCAKACCALPSMQEKIRAHNHYISSAKVYLSRHNVDMCGSLVRHANLHSTRVRLVLHFISASVTASVRLVLVLLAAKCCVRKIIKLMSYKNQLLY